MVVAPLPENEQARLDALYALRLFDSSAEERFDRITNLAAEIFEVPMAFVSLVDRNRQWLKSKVGLDICESSRDVSFCAHAILNEEALVINDTHLDQRFSDNPLVTGELSIRFYAGRPLQAPGGEKIGTLCIADRKPRSFRTRELSLLKQLGSLVERELRTADLFAAQENLLKTQRDLLKTQERLATELKSAGKYVASLLPQPIKTPLFVDWRFLPSEDLGGDCLGFHFLEDGRCAFYVLDVCGHGVDAAMLSVTLMNVLRSRDLQGVDFADPAAVLHALNQRFQMSRHGGKFFTIWYGVLDPSSGRVSFASGGHPPAIVVRPGVEAYRLSNNGIAIGCVQWARYENSEADIARGDVCYLFSDGAYEIRASENHFFSMDDFEKLLVNTTTQAPPSVGPIVQKLQANAAGFGFSDDVSLLEVRLE